MKRALPLLNLVGVLLLSTLCIIQWQINRRINLEVNRLEKIRLDQEARIAEQEKAAKAAATDLELFREQLHATVRSRKAAEDKVHVLEQDNHQLAAERDQLKESVRQWTEAVAARDEQLKLAVEHLEKAGRERNEAVLKFNDLAEKYNGVVTNLNQRTADFNALVEKYNKLAKSQ
jgi:chromosome segregation ATPase